MEGNSPNTESVFYDEKAETGWYNICYSSIDLFVHWLYPVSFEFFVHLITAQLAHMMNDVESVLLEVLGEKCDKDEIIPAYKTSQGLTFQIITKTAFAMDVDCQRDENV